MEQVNMSKIINYLTILGLFILLSVFFLDNWIQRLVIPVQLKRSNHVDSPSAGYCNSCTIYLL